MPSTPTFNGIVWGANLWNGGRSAMESFSSDLVVFEGFSLSDNDSVVCTNLIDSGPTREILGSRVPRGDGEYITGDFWRQKVIEVRGFVKKDTAEELDDFLDTMRKNLRVREGNLDITRYDTARRFVATLTNAEELFASREGYHITFCPFVARFVCKTPFGMDREYTANTFTFATTPRNETMQNIGTIEAQPVFIFIFDSASSVTAVNIQRVDTDGNVLDEIEFTDTIAAGDILEFNSEDKVVNLNGEQVSYTGSFPELAIGSNTIKLSVTGASFSATTTTKMKNRFL